MEEINLRSVNDHTMLYSVSDKILLAYVFSDFVEDSNEPYDSNPLYFVPRPGSTHQCK